MSLVVDAHVHVGPVLRNHSDEPEFDASTPEAAVQAMDRFGIDVGVAFAPLYEGGDFDDPFYERANVVIFELTQRYPDRFVGYGRVNPNLMARAVNEARRCIEEYRLRGLMFHPAWEAFVPTNQRLVWPLAEICAEHGLPMSFHTGWNPTCQPMLFVPLAEAFPQVPIYLKHIGYGFWRDATIVASRLPNLYIETSGNSTSGHILAAIRGAGADKVCFGSDLPYTLPDSIIQKIRGLPISDVDKAKVLGLNSARINRIPLPAPTGY